MGADAGDAERRTAAGPDDAPAAAGPGSIARPSPATLRAYEADWAGFRAWCRAEGRAYGRNGVSPELPADPGTVAAHIEALAPTHGGAALRRRVAAIGFHHRLSELVWDASHPAIRAALRALGRGHAPRRPRRRVAMPKASELPHLLAACGADLAGLRDRALLLLAVAGGLGRAELVGLDREHVRHAAGGLVLTVAPVADGAGGVLMRNGPNRIFDAPPPLAPTPEVLAPAHTDWLYHHLAVAGPTDDVARFRAAAAGAGVVPWAMDWDRLEEDWAHLLLAPPPPQRRTLSAAGARVLAGGHCHVN